MKELYINTIDMIPSFNLFDFSQWVNPNDQVGSLPIPWIGIDNSFKPNMSVAPEQFNVPSSYNPSSVIPSASAAESDIIQSYLDDKSVSYDNRKTVFQMLQDNVPKDQIEWAINSVYKSKQVQPIQTQQEQAQQEDTGILSSIWKGIDYAGSAVENFVWWVAAELPAAAGWVASVITQLWGKINPFTTKEQDKAAAEYVKNLWEKWSEFVKQYGKYDPKSFWAKAGELTTDLVSTAVWPGKFIKWAGKVAKVGNLLATGIADANKWTAVTEGRTATPWETAAFTVLWWVWSYLTKSQPSKLMSSGIPKKVLEQVDDSFRTLTGKEFDPTKAGKWLLDNGITGSYNSQVAKLSTVVPLYEKSAEKVLSDAGTQVINNSTTKELQNALTEVLWNLGTWTKWKNAKFMPSAGNKEISDIYLNLINKPGLTFKEIDQARKVLWEKIFTPTSNFKDAATLKGWQNVWLDASKFLDKSVPLFRELNKNVQVGNTMLKAVKSKTYGDMASEVLKNLVKTWFTWAGGWAVAWGTLWYFAGGKTEEWAKIGAGLALWGWAFRMLVNNPTFRTELANVLNKASSQGRSWITNAKMLQKLWNGKKISSSLVDQVKEVIAKFAELPGTYWDVLPEVWKQIIRGWVSNIITNKNK